MFRRNFGYLGGGATVLVLATQLVACGGDDTTSPPVDTGPDASTSPVDGGSSPGDSGSAADAGGSAADAGLADATTDATTSDAGAAFLCSGGKALPIFGTYLASDGTTQWLRQSASAATYSRIPAGAPASKSPPSLWLITQVCSDQQVFVAQSETGTYARVDYAQSGDAVQLCIASQGATDPATALGAPLSVPGSATGCKGGAWLTLTRTKTDGGL